MRKYTIAVLGLFACIAGRQLQAAENEADASAKLLATEVCSVCHGPGGRSTLQAIPSLAAQPRQYLRGKINLFRKGPLAKSEEHIDVLGLLLIDDPTTEALARYFANQPPPAPVIGDAALIETGSKIFMQGAPAHGVAACSICHGQRAAGFWIFPRLAGQHADYVERQLKQIQSRLRDVPVMHGIIKDMSADEIKAVAAYVQAR